jgi:hypothetical protein
VLALTSMNGAGLAAAQALDGERLHRHPE